MNIYIWVALMGIIPPAVVSFIVGWILFKYGQKLGKQQYKMAKREIRTYIKEELLSDIGEAMRDHINGVIGPIGKLGTAEGRSATIEYARQNPGIAQMLMDVAGRSGARWLARQFGVPKDQADILAGLGTRSSIPPGIMEQIQGRGAPKKQDADLKPVKK